jgi:hypothetical protein
VALSAKRITGRFRSVTWALLLPVVLLAGGAGAFAQADRDWRAGRAWRIWRDACRILLGLTLVGNAVPAIGLMG